VAREVLAARHRKLRKLAKNFPVLSDDGRHRLRINAKKARYAAEFFRTLFPRKQAQRYARALAEMQDCLGSMNDAVVGHDLVQELTQDDDAFARATDMLAGWHAARIEGDMPRAGGDQPQDRQDRSLLGNSLKQATRPLRDNFRPAASACARSWGAALAAWRRPTPATGGHGARSISAPCGADPALSFPAMSFPDPGP
jgi:hypothetical protein